MPLEGVGAAGAKRVAMAISPVELKHERPPLRLLGYSRSEVDHLIGEATEAYETVWRERADLDDRVHELEQKLNTVHETEDALRDALVSAEKIGDERRSAASREAETIVRESEVRAREILHGAYAEREKVRVETERLRAEEAEFRLRLRALIGTTLQCVRDHEESIAVHADPAQELAPVAEDTQIAPPPEEG
jgi:cell division initiation protein